MSVNNNKNTNFKKPVKIYCRIIFIKIGEVDSRNERFAAEAFVEAIWEDEQIFKQLIQQKNFRKSLF
jgi:hypothetical protein